MLLIQYSLPRNAAWFSKTGCKVNKKNFNRQIFFSIFMFCSIKNVKKPK